MVKLPNPFARSNPKEKRDDTQKTAEEVYQEGVTTLQDVVAPSAFEIAASNVQVGKKIARTFFVFSYPKYLSTGWFSSIINYSEVFDAALFIEPIDSAIALKNLRKKIAEVESQVVEREQKGQVRDPLLEAAYRNIEDLRDKLQEAEERLFNLSLYITIYADSREDLDRIENEIRSLLESKLIDIKTAIYEQKEGFDSTSPLCINKLQISTPLNSGSISSAFPFISFELSQGAGILYGINRHNSGLVLFDRFELENANSVIFGKSGSGKSYAVKLEVLRSLMLGVDVIIIDPENEYQYLAEAVGGAFFKISLTSPHHINPFDLPLPGEDENPGDLLRSNIINLVGLLRIMLGGLTPEEGAIIDTAVSETYASRDITPESDFSHITPPLLSDLEAILENMEGGASLARRLQKYTKGTYAEFLNQHTNIETAKRLVVFNIRDMEEELRPIAMYIILRYVWNLIRQEVKKRVLVVDEAWWLMQYEEGASFLYGIAKRARKYYLGLTTITQDVGDFMGSRYGKPIVTNSSLQFLLRQSPATIDTVVKTFNLTQGEKYMLLEAAIGEGLFFAGQKHIAIKIIASYTEDQIITSDPEQLLKIRQAKEELQKTQEQVM